MLFLDALALSFRTIERSYRTLQFSLAAHTPALEISDARDDDTRIDDVVIAAWSIIDALHRLARLVPQLPGLRHGPAVESFRRSVAEVEDLRHAVQHLESEIEKLSDTSDPVWGHLTWVAPVGDRMTVSWLVPGHLAVGPLMEVPVPTGEAESPVDHIKLRAASKTVDLSSMYRATALFAGRLEEGVGHAWAELPETGANHQPVRITVPV